MSDNHEHLQSIKKEWELGHKSSTVTAVGASIWSYYHRRGEASITFSESGMAQYRLNGRTFKDLLPDALPGNMTCLTAGSLFAEALLQLGRDEHATKPKEWENLQSNAGLDVTDLTEMRNTLKEIAEDKSWHLLDQKIDEYLEEKNLKKQTKRIGIPPKLLLEGTRKFFEQGMNPKEISELLQIDFKTAVEARGLYYEELENKPQSNI